MNDIARLYNCSRCHSQVTICRQCDRGNVYCGQCAPLARTETRRRAATRYQASFQGRLNHAARQRRYRERLKQKVTHQGSTRSLVHDLLVHKYKKAKQLSLRPKSTKTKAIYCHTCCMLCSPFLRINFLYSTDL